LHEAGQRWGSVHRDTETLADRVEVLRQIMVELWPQEPDAVHGVLDAVVASAALALSRRLEVGSRTDALTGAGNRWAFDESLGAAIASASRQH
jgi:GGDEF domain-containing protein